MGLFRRLMGNRPMSKDRLYEIMFRRSINVLVFASVVGFSYTIIRGTWWVICEYLIDLLFYTIFY